MLQYSSEFVYSIYAPVAQWIERSPPERKAAVQIQSGAIIIFKQK